MLDGMRNLQQLSLRNNSLSALENLTFTSVPQITILDLAHNSIHTIEKNVFTPLKNIFWLDLSFNLIKTIEKNTFKEKIANILLNGMFEYKSPTFQTRIKLFNFYKIGNFFTLEIIKKILILISSLNKWN